MEESHEHSSHYHCIYTPHNRVLLGLEKEWNNAICSNLDGPRDYHTMCTM